MNHSLVREGAEYAINPLMAHKIQSRAKLKPDLEHTR